MLGWGSRAEADLCGGCTAAPHHNTLSPPQRLAKRRAKIWERLINWLIKKYKSLGTVLLMPRSWLGDRHREGRASPPLLPSPLLSPSCCHTWFIPAAEAQSLPCGGILFSGLKKLQKIINTSLTCSPTPPFPFSSSSRAEDYPNCEGEEKGEKTRQQQASTSTPRSCCPVTCNLPWDGTSRDAAVALDGAGAKWGCVRS